MGRKKTQRQKMMRKRYPKKPENDRWKEMFRIESKDEHAKLDVGGFTLPLPDPFRDKVRVHSIIDISTGEVLGKYSSWLYAIKQARYKYKRRMRKVEKILLVE